ncbi:hypothetical protein Bca52824_048458 [Brassica carinata]|uniref:Phytocyanin domain-containing protein n=2 Tax=Brassica TaxID=3705 RepID=A0A8X7US77_BRACI|nr:hypothetical protein Bca52824_048458 [Brassica carinata]CAF1830944.1 unnamed protein product [Brassica napus]
MLVEVELSLEMLKDIGRELGDTHRARGELGNAWGRERRLGWSEEKQFHVGDTLIFEYANEVNDVYQINGDLEFMTCDPTSPIAVHKTGHDLVKLTEP